MFYFGTTSRIALGVIFCLYQEIKPIQLICGDTESLSISIQLFLIKLNYFPSSHHSETHDHGKILPPSGKTPFFILNPF
jgi:hypothetical protein